MTEHFHAVVWIDHHAARIIHFNETASDTQLVHPKDEKLHLHHHANANDSGHAPEDQNYFHHVVSAFSKARAVLVTGPANAKNELVKHIKKHDPTLEKIIAGVEAIDHPTDGELLAHARRFFKISDRTKPQISE